MPIGCVCQARSSDRYLMPQPPPPFSFSANSTGNENERWYCNASQEERFLTLRFGQPYLGLAFFLPPGYSTCLTAELPPREAL